MKEFRPLIVRHNNGADINDNGANDNGVDIHTCDKIHTIIMDDSVNIFSFFHNDTRHHILVIDASSSSNIKLSISYIEYKTMLCDKHTIQTFKNDIINSNAVVSD